MEYIRKLSNNNRISYGTFRNAIEEIREDNYTFKFILKGQQDYIIAKRTVSIFPDCFLFLPRGTRYKSIIDSFDAVDLLSISVSADFMDSLHPGHTQCPYLSGLESFYPLSGDMRSNLLHLCQQVIRQEADEQRINESVRHCLNQYFQVHQRETSERIGKIRALKASTRQELFKKLTLAKEYISNNYNKKFNLDDVAGFSCLSVNHLLRNFKEAYGLSPNQFLSRIRLDRAKYFLEESNHSVSCISMLVGFDSISSFIRLFKSVFKTTPLKYKRRFFELKSC